MTQALDIVIDQQHGDRTQAIQAAMDHVSASGGGRVSLAAGSHQVGGLTLRSGVELHLGEGAVLRPVPDYQAYGDNIVSVIAEKSNRGMLVARGADTIALTGPGRIDASGDSFIAGDDVSVGVFIPAEFRPRVLVLEGCRGVRLDNVHVENSPMWTLHFVNCEDVSLANVAIRNNCRLPNTDGIVLDACRRVLIEDCTISTADDGICLKTSVGPDGKAIGTCEDVLVRRCAVSSQSCALKLGTESFGDFSRVVFEDCRVEQSNRGLGIFSRDGGKVSDVRFSRINLDCRETPDGFWGSGEALTVTVVDRVPERPAGAVRGLVIEDITGRMEGTINLVSMAGAGIHDVALHRVHLAQQPGVLGTALRYDMRPTNADLAPSPEAHGRANAWTRGADGRIVGLIDYPGGMPGVFARGVEGLTIDDLVIDRPQPLPEGWNPLDFVQQ
ncbi:glycoside hydrolase family 28 protein [Agrobacterium vitis]|uniref:Glycoside hydrolase family 28 protein n=1 Tax=Agrobacterium vitis TaxID=373 RepID=A0AAE2R968_AGRVI|nr:glycoside hydrolase family 28 protein [Agrobacterium vitis]MBF2713382.1 glycoside hydrolase family 28 protein [Agrobacterium vitis]MUZ62441.1 glycoside hydrolase family 28 protein [Agrobacterium vitis]